MMPSFVLGSSVRQVRPTLSYYIKYMEVSISLEDAQIALADSSLLTPVLKYVHLTFDKLNF